MPLQHIGDQQCPQSCTETKGMRKGLMVRSAEADLHRELALESQP